VLKRRDCIFKNFGRKKPLIDSADKLEENWYFVSLTPTAISFKTSLQSATRTSYPCSILPDGKIPFKKCKFLILKKKQD
jgi:hypothetical protein